MKSAPLYVNTTPKNIQKIKWIKNRLNHVPWSLQLLDTENPQKCSVL